MPQSVIADASASISKTRAKTAIHRHLSERPGFCLYDL